MRSPVYLLFMKANPPRLTNPSVAGPGSALALSSTLGILKDLCLQHSRPLEQFALTEAMYTTVHLLQEFSNIESRDPEPWTEQLGVICSSANGVKVAMIPVAEQSI